MEPQQDTCVVVPTYNEAENIPRLVEEVRKFWRPGMTLLFIDDSSPDGTADIVRGEAARDGWIRLVVRGSKQGIGSAYREGFRVATRDLGAAIVVEMDADLQHPPSGIGSLVLAVQGGADVAVGSRYLEGGSISGWSLWRRVVSKGANIFARVVLGLPVRDATSGFRAYSRAAAVVVADSRLPNKGFEFQVASLHLLKTKMKMVEVPYEFSPRKSGTSKLGILDMGRFFLAVIRMSLR